MRDSFAFLFATIILLSPSSFAQTEPTETCEHVEIAKVEVFCIKHGLGTFTAQERADKIATRITELAADYTFDVSTILVTTDSDALQIDAGGKIIASLKPGDVEDIDAKEITSRLQKSIEAYRHARRPDTLLWGLAYSLMATLVLSLTLFLLKRVYSAAYVRVQNDNGRLIPALKIQSRELLSSGRITDILLWAISTARSITILFAFYVYIPLVLSFFPWTEKWTPKLYGYILDPISSIFQVTIDYLPNFFHVVVIVILSFYLLKFIHFLFTEIERGTLSFQGFYPEWAQPTYKLTRFIVIAMAFVMAFPYLPGSNSPAFQGVSVFLGILLSFGSSSAISNIVSGMVITYMRPFRIGDRVKIADTFGDVVEKNLLMTRVKTIKNVEITVPNSLVLGSHIVNYSTLQNADGLILNTTVTIGYDAPWAKVHDLLKEAAAKTPLIDKTKAPFILQTALNDFYVAYELNAFTKDSNKMAQIYSDLHQNIQDAFNAGGVEIMSPHYTCLRDGNEVTIPELSRPSGYRKPTFDISTAQSKN